MEYITVFKTFQELSTDELYALLKLRSEVFVVEQNCVFLDQDDKDQESYHILLYTAGKLSGYARIVPAGLSYTELAIGRVCTSQAARGKGMGKALMLEAIKYCYQQFGVVDIRLGAQTYAIDFYASLGFVPDGDPYDEDGIEHIEMVKRGAAN